MERCTYIALVILQGAPRQVYDIWAMVHRQTSASYVQDELCQDAIIMFSNVRDA